MTWDEFDRMQRAVLERMVNGARGRRVPRVAITRDLALLNLLGETGLRANEAVNLTVRDVDLGNGLLTVRRAKGKRERVLSILGTPEDPDPRRVLRLLEQWIDTRNALRGAQGHAYLWTSIKGNPLNADELRHVLGRICVEAGVNGSRPPHAFRRFQFTERYREDPTALKQLSARMGWSPNSRGMETIYTRGVEMEFSRDRIPLMASRQRTVQFAPLRPTDDLTREVTAAIQKNPELARALLQALRGVA